MNKRLVMQAVSSLIAVSVGISAPAFGSNHGEMEREQCAGVIRGGMNDCATSQNACHGHVKEDANPEAWIYVPKGTCDRIAGARIVHVVDPTPKKS